jgi:hypothetical protein
MALREIQEKKRVEADALARSMRPQKPPFKMNEEQEGFITFLNECGTTIKSVMIDLLKTEIVPEPISPTDRFEAPKLTAMMNEIKEMTQQIAAEPDPTPRTSKHILTPAAAYFAFSAPFDDTDEFIASETWSFAKYEPGRPQSGEKKSRIVRIKNG